MGLLGAGAFVGWWDIADGELANYEQWHSQEHMPERVGIPGILRGRRYLVNGEGPRYLVTYEVDEVGTLTSEAYLSRLNNPTPWTREVTATMQGMARTLCRVTGSFGAGFGSTLLLIRLSPLPGKAETLRQWLSTEGLSGLVDERGLVSASLVEGDREASSVESEEKRVRGRPDDIADWMILVDGYDLKAVKSVRDVGLSRDRIEERGGAQIRTVGIYDLACVVSGTDV